MVTDLITLMEGAALSKFVGPAAEQLGKAAWERAQQLGTKAQQLLAAVGRQPQAVEPKVLFPLVQAASLEAEESLVDIWAALLANTADPAQRVRVQTGFIEVLRQLTPEDAQVLRFIYAHLSADTSEQSGEPDSPLTVEDVLTHFSWPDGKVELSLDNLLRCRLFEVLAGGTYGPSPALHPNMPTAFTTYGQQFLTACTPPTT